MYDLYRIKPLKMLTWWVACSFFVFPLTIIVLGIVGLPTLFVFDAIFPSLMSEPLAETVIGIITVPIVGAIIGLCMAFLQRWILRTKLYWTADGWYLWSGVGGAVGASIAALYILIVHPKFFIYGGDAAFQMMPIFLMIVSTFQFLALRHAVKQAWFWIIANFVAGIVYMGLISKDPSSDIMILALVFMSIAAMGLITGTVLLFLFEHKLLPLQPEDTKHTDVDAPKSVWDQAI